MLNIVISILKLKELAVILGRWNLAEARKYMPEGRVDNGSCAPYKKEWQGEAALSLPKIHPEGTKLLTENLPCAMFDSGAPGIFMPGFGQHLKSCLGW